VMMVDADERMTPELKEAIAEALPVTQKPIVAYWIQRRNYIADYWLKHGGWFPGDHLKLYNKNYVKWKEDKYDLVHPGMEFVTGCHGIMLPKGHLIHYNFANIEDFINKLNKQTTLEALKWHIQGKKLGLLHAFWKIFDRFFRRYVRKKGYKDGYYGFVAAVLSGFYQFAAYSKLQEIRKRNIYLDRYTD
jgi:hypothetical protein